MKKIVCLLAIALIALTGCASDQKYRNLVGSDNQKLKAIKAVVNDIGPDSKFYNTWTTGNKYYIYYENMDAVELEFNKDYTKCKALYYTGANTIILNNSKQDYKINSYSNVYNMTLNVTLGFISKAEIVKSGVGLNYKDTTADNVSDNKEKTLDWVKSDATEAATWLYFYKIFLHQNLRDDNTYIPSLTNVNKYIENNRTNIDSICDNFLMSSLCGKEEAKLFVTNYLKNPKSSYLARFKGKTYDQVYEENKKIIKGMSDVTVTGFLSGIKLTDENITFVGDISEPTSDQSIWDINNHKEG